jgi:DNA processing protein
LPDPLTYKIAVSMIPGLGDVTAKKVIAYVGSVEGVFRESRKNLVKIPGIGEIIAGCIVNARVMEEAEKEAEYVVKEGITARFYLDEGYPQRLLQCPDAPVILFIKGEADLNCRKILSIVGTRSATTHGKELCQHFIRELKERGHEVLIVSGLAYGIDVTSHRAALKYNLPTAAILGHGLRSIYPSTHAAVAREIAQHGALVTDFISTMKPERNNFIKRNRIIAGICDAVIIVESAEKGGALITADLANSYNRDVFAIPGRVNDPWSAGCNQLIKQHKADLLERVTDLEYMLGWENKDLPSREVQTRMFVTLSSEEQQIMDTLGGEMLTIDEIAIRLGWPVSRASALLLTLEFSGLLQCLPGKIYRKSN